MKPAALTMTQAARRLLAQQALAVAYAARCAKPRGHDPSAEAVARQQSGAAQQVAQQAWPRASLDGARQRPAAPAAARPH